MKQMHMIFCHKYYQEMKRFATSRWVNYLTNFKLDCSLVIGLFNVTYSIFILEELNTVWRKPANLDKRPTHIYDRCIFKETFMEMMRFLCHNLFCHIFFFFFIAKTFFNILQKLSSFFWKNVKGFFFLPRKLTAFSHQLFWP